MLVVLSVSGKSKGSGYDVMMHFHADQQERLSFESAIAAFVAAVNLGYTADDLIVAVDKFISPRRAIANSLGELPVGAAHASATVAEITRLMEMCAPDETLFLQAMLDVRAKGVPLPAPRLAGEPTLSTATHGQPESNN